MLDVREVSKTMIEKIEKYSEMSSEEQAEELYRVNENVKIFEEVDRVLKEFNSDKCKNKICKDRI